MIVSHEHRYVFIEVPHTGSVAISRELRENYGGEQILRKHATYRDFLRQATPAQREYFSFAAVRHPLDLTVSRYFRFKLKERPAMGNPEWIAKHGSVAQKLDLRVAQWIVRNDASFEEFLLRWYRVPFDSWTSLDQARYSSVIRFETLADDFERTVREIGLQPVRPLPPANATPGRDRNWIAHYTPRARRRATWVFGPYMQQWGYDFPAEWGRVRVPAWSKVYFRLARAGRSVYWRFLRFRNPRRPGRLSESPFTQR